MQNVIWAAVAACLASLLLTPAVIRFAHSRRILDIPADGRRMHDRPIPRVGGVAVFLAMAVGLLGLGAVGQLPRSAPIGWTGFLAGILIGGAVLFAAGLWDDLRGLSPTRKVIAQFVAAGVVYAFGFRVDAINLGSLELQLGFFGLPLTILWIVAITNAFNLIDGLDGLATGIAIVALATTLAVSMILGNLEVAFVCAALLGALVGFLRYNFNPARIFLGDSGSLFVGFMLAVLSVHGSLKSSMVVVALIPPFALAIPLLDTTLAVLRRWLRGVPLAGADASHIHHRLLASGLSQRGAVGVLYAAATVFSVVGVYIAFAPPARVVVVTFAGGMLCAIVFFFGMRRLQYHEFFEAGAVLAHGALRVRRVIQDQIHARDLAQSLGDAEDIQTINHILDGGAARFHFLGMELCREATPCDGRLARMNGDSARAWKLDYPVTPRADAEDDPFVLRIWCGPGHASRPHGAERIARLLAPVVERWLYHNGFAYAEVVPDGTPLPARADGSSVLDSLGISAAFTSASGREVVHGSDRPRRALGTPRRA